MSINKHVGAVCLSGLLIAACGTRPPAKAQAPTVNAGEAAVMNQGSDISIPQYDPHPATMTARTAGVLALEGNCLVLHRANGTERDLPVFPRGAARWDADARALTFRGKAYRIGDTVTLDGGAMRADAPSLPAIDGMPDGCAKDFVWLVG